MLNSGSQNCQRICQAKESVMSMSTDEEKKKQRKPQCMQGAGVIWSKASGGPGVGRERTQDRKQISRM